MSEIRSSLSIPDSGFVVVSGGQTGVDRAALDAAMQIGIPVTGWCPRERRAEDGPVPEDYPLVETSSLNYAVRTEWNVRDSDGTLIVALNELTGGTGLTAKLARQHNQPYHVVRLLARKKSALGNGNSEDDQIVAVVDWIRAHKIRVLNVAGPRGSSDNRIYPLAHSFCREVLTALLAASSPDSCVISE